MIVGRDALFFSWTLDAKPLRGELRYRMEALVQRIGEGVDIPDWTPDAGAIDGGGNGMDGAVC